MYSNFSNIIKMISEFFVTSLILGLLGLLLIIRLGLSKRIKNVRVSKILDIIEIEIKNNSQIHLMRDSQIFFTSILYWFTRLLMGYFILNMLGINLSFFTISFISLAVFMLGLIPIQFFAGFGITEAGFLFFLLQFGFKYETTLMTVLMYHIYLLIPIVFFGLAGLVWLKPQK